MSINTLRSSDRLPRLPFLPSNFFTGTTIGHKPWPHLPPRWSVPSPHHAGGIVLTTATLYWAQKILVPLALAVLLAFVLNPLVAMVQRRGLPRVPSVILIACLSFLLLGVIGFGLTLQMKQLVAELPKYNENVSKKVADLRAMGHGKWLLDLEQSTCAGNFQCSKALVRWQSWANGLVTK